MHYIANTYPSLLKKYKKKKKQKKKKQKKKSAFDCREISILF